MGKVSWRVEPRAVGEGVGVGGWHKEGFRQRRRGRGTGPTQAGLPAPCRGSARLCLRVPCDMSRAGSPLAHLKEASHDPARAAGHRVPGSARHRSASIALFKLNVSNDDVRSCQGAVRILSICDDSRRSFLIYTWTQNRLTISFILLTKKVPLILKQSSLLTRESERFFSPSRLCI